jgi:hypothetical protein
MPYERPLIQERRAAKPHPETEYRRASMLGVLSHAATTKFGVDVQTDQPERLAAEFVRFRSAWHQAHGAGPLDGLKIKALSDRVRITRETLSEQET